MEHIPFGGDDADRAFARLGRNQIDQLLPSTIEVDEEGKILSYSAGDAPLDSQGMVGRNLFRDVPPWTEMRELYARFREGVDGGALNVLIDDVLDRGEAGAMRLKVQMKKAIGGQTYWILVKRFRDQGTSPKTDSLAG